MPSIETERARNLLRAELATADHCLKQFVREHGQEFDMNYSQLCEYRRLRSEYARAFKRLADFNRENKETPARVYSLGHTFSTQAHVDDLIDRKRDEQEGENACAS
ncbi:MAG: hypothetical protein ACRD3W_23790 [Terriglobales bacterium]